MSFLFNKQTTTADEKSIPYVSGNNVFLDDVPLLEKNAYGRMQPREKSILHKLFSHFYHCDLEIGSRLEKNLVSMAEAINNGRPALAAIMLVHMNLPRREMVAKYNPNHAPAHAPNSTGGQFTSGDSDGVGPQYASAGNIVSDGVVDDGVKDSRKIPNKLGVTQEDRENPRFAHMNDYKIMEQKFVDAHLATFEKGAEKLDVPVENLIALSAEESSWGRSDAALDDMNFFGLHATVPLQIGSRPATKNPDVDIAMFKNFEDSMNSFIQSKGHLVEGISDPTAFAWALQNNGRFGIDTDNDTQVPTYVSDIVRIAKSLPGKIAKTRELNQ